MKHLRLATAEEISSIKDRSDLMPGHTQIFVLDAEQGTPDIAVVRNCIEVDPVIYGERTNDLRRSRFLWSLEERLLGAGVDRFYFQLDASNEHYIKVAKSWGAEQVSPHPEVRMLKVIK